MLGNVAYLCEIKKKNLSEESLLFVFIILGFKIS